MGEDGKRPDRTGRIFTIASTVLVTAVLTSMMWIIVYNIVSAPDEVLTPAGNTVTLDPPGAAPVEIAEGLVVGPAGLAIPVAGVQAEDLVDTFTQARAGGARRHDAIDIMAPEGTPVLAAAPGIVERLFYSQGGGGITIYIRSHDRRWSYYYAHLQRYADGLEEGQKIERGRVIGFVGHTGNASPDGPHLHFAIHRMAPEDSWHGGAAINPYPLLAGQSASG